MNPLAKNVRSRMIELRMTQQSLADKAGLSQSMINKITSGKVSKTKYIHELAHALECNSEWLSGDRALNDIQNVQSEPPQRGATVVHGDAIMVEITRIQPGPHGLLLTGLHNGEPIEAHVAALFSSDQEINELVMAMASRKLVAIDFVTRNGQMMVRKATVVE